MGRIRTRWNRWIFLRLSKCLEQETARSLMLRQRVSNLKAKKRDWMDQGKALAADNRKTPEYLELEAMTREATEEASRSMLAPMTETELEDLQLSMRVLITRLRENP